jgi:hypothetical protein
MGCLSGGFPFTVGLGSGFDKGLEIGISNLIHHEFSVKGLILKDSIGMIVMLRSMGLPKLGEGCHGLKTDRSILFFGEECHVDFLLPSAVANFSAGLGLSVGEGN